MIHVRLEQQDIDNGEVGSDCNCPGSLAIKRATGSKLVRVGVCNIYIDGKWFKTPEDLSVFIKTFDGLPEDVGGKAIIGNPVDYPNVKPFEFDLIPIE